MFMCSFDRLGWAPFFLWCLYYETRVHAPLASAPVPMDMGQQWELSGNKLWVPGHWHCSSRKEA
eukprot:6133463-Amphidinium_carterae.2